MQYGRVKLFQMEKDASLTQNFVQVALAGEELILQEEKTNSHD